jgi:hypothetical protein
VGVLTLLINKHDRIYRVKYNYTLVFVLSSTINISRHLLPAAMPDPDDAMVAQLERKQFQVQERIFLLKY